MRLLRICQGQFDFWYQFKKDLLPTYTWTPTMNLIISSLSWSPKTNEMYVSKFCIWFPQSHFVSNSTEPNKCSIKIGYWHSKSNLSLLRNWSRKKNWRILHSMPGIIYPLAASKEKTCQNELSVDKMMFSF